MEMIHPAAARGTPATNQSGYRKSALLIRLRQVPIAGGDDLTAAKSQNEVMSKAKTSLQDAVLKAVKANKGYKAMSAVPSVKEGHTIAEITLMKGAASKTVSEQVD